MVVVGGVLALTSCDSKTVGKAPVQTSTSNPDYTGTTTQVSTAHRTTISTTTMTTTIPTTVESKKSPNSMSYEGRNSLIDLEGGFLAVPTRIENEDYYTIGAGHYGMDTESMSVSNSSPYFSYKGVDYSNNNPMPKSVAIELLSEDIKKYENPVNNFVSNNNLILNQYQYDALVMDTYQRGQNIWGLESHRPLEDYLINGDYSDLYSATNAFNYDLSAIDGVQNRRIMEAEYFVTGKYTDIR